MFAEERLLARTKRAAQVYAEYKIAFETFGFLLDAFLKEQSDLGVIIDSTAPAVIGITYLDRPLEIRLSVALDNDQKLKGVLKLVAIDTSSESKRKIEVSRIYIDHLGNAWNALEDRMSFGAITANDGARQLLLIWLREFLTSDKFDLP